MLKFLADMGIARHTVHFLRDSGYDAVHLRDQGLQRLGDEMIIEKARREQRVIITHDLDFGRFVALGRTSLPSVITFRLSDMRPESVERSLIQVVRTQADVLQAGALVSITNRAVQVRRLPIERKSGAG